ncbi:MAG TPA: ribonuclease P protein component [Parvularculaceae bacterium]|nr:ribonuclease P protein component [Parvularculaceae bacterium]
MTASPGPRPALAFLKKRSDFLALRSGARHSAPAFLLIRRRRGGDDPTIRVGFTATKKLGPAVVRNRIRRRLREAARAIFPDHGEPGCDYVLIARIAAASRKYADLLDDLKRGLLSLARRST